MALSFEELGISPVKHGTYSTWCPKCSPHRKPENRKKPCLTVWNEPNNQGWKCNHPGCDFSGNLKQYGQYDKVRETSRMPAIKPSIYTPQVNEYLASRQISPDVAQRRGIYEIKNHIGNAVICYPYYYGRTLVNVMFRNVIFDKAKGELREWQTKKADGAKSCFWGLELLDLDKSKDVIIIEGQTDAMTWDMCGYANVLSIPMGASLASADKMEEKLSFVTDPYVVELFKDVRRFYVLMDNDEAGIHFAKALADRLGKERCWLPIYPQGYKDSNEIYAGDAKKGLDPQGKSGIDKMFEMFYPFPLKGIITVKMVMDQIMEVRNHGYKKGLITGNPEVDRLISLKQGMLSVITGIPGFSKSSIWRWLTTEYVKKNQSLEFAAYTPESRPVGREYSKIAEIVSGQRVDKNWHNSMSDEKLMHTMNYVQSHFTIIDPDTNNFEVFGKKMDPKLAYSPKGLRSILAYMKYLKETKGIYGFWIDAWNKLDHQRPKEKQIEEFISQELDYLLEFLNREQLQCTIIAHPTKMERVRGGNFKRPSLYDIKGSSAWNEKVDIGLIAHRNMYKKTNQKDPDTDEEIWELDKHAATTLTCEKMKFDELGEVGEVKMWMDKSAGDRFVFTDPHKETFDTKMQTKKKKILVGEPMPADPEEENNPFIPSDDIPF